MRFLNKIGREYVVDGDVVGLDSIIAHLSPAFSVIDAGELAMVLDNYQMTDAANLLRKGAAQTYPEMAQRWVGHHRDTGCNDECPAIRMEPFLSPSDAE